MFHFLNRSPVAESVTHLLSPYASPKPKEAIESCETPSSEEVARWIKRIRHQAEKAAEISTPKEVQSVMEILRILPDDDIVGKLDFNEPEVDPRLVMDYRHAQVKRKRDKRRQRTALAEVTEEKLNRVASRPSSASVTPAPSATKSSHRDTPSSFSAFVTPKSRSTSHQTPSSSHHTPCASSSVLRTGERSVRDSPLLRAEREHQLKVLSFQHKLDTRKRLQIFHVWHLTAKTTVERRIEEEKIQKVQSKVQRRNLYRSFHGWFDTAKEIWKRRAHLLQVDAFQQKLLKRQQSAILQEWHQIATKRWVERELIGRNLKQQVAARTRLTVFENWLQLTEERLARQRNIVRIVKLNREAKAVLKLFSVWRTWAVRKGEYRMDAVRRIKLNTTKCIRRALFSHWTAWAARHKEKRLEEEKRTQLAARIKVVITNSAKQQTVVEEEAHTMQPQQQQQLMTITAPQVHIKPSIPLLHLIPSANIYRDSTEEFLALEAAVSDRHILEAPSHRPSPPAITASRLPRPKTVRTPAPVPANVIAMQERAERRKESREQLQRQYEAAEERKAQMLIQMEQEKFERLEQQRLDRIEAKRREREEVERRLLEAEQERMQMEALSVLARGHYQLSLLQRWGWLPWMRIVHTLRAKEQRADELYRQRLMRNAWAEMIQMVEDARIAREQAKAKREVKGRALANAARVYMVMKGWKELVSWRRGGLQLAAMHRRRVLQRQMLRAWREQTAFELDDEKQLVRAARPLIRRIELRFAFQTWRRYIVEWGERKAKEERVAQLRSRAMRLLQEAQSSARSAREVTLFGK